MLNEKTMTKLRLICILLFPTLVYAQVNLTGVVLNKKTQQPIEYVTVYINGSTQGTITDSRGFFEFESLTLPCQLVVSHVSFITKSITVTSENPEQLEILLIPKKVDLSVLEVEDDNLRLANLRRFTADFLGSDYWGVKAKLINDEVLTFRTEYYPKEFDITEANRQMYKTYYEDQDVEWSADSTVVAVQTKSKFSVSADEPLIVDLPLLGYEVHVNLIDFTVYHQLGNMSTYLAYYYFKPYAEVSRRKSRRYSKNRKEVYYNSSQHFCRSLFANELAENGYVLLERLRADTMDASQDVNLVKPIMSSRFSSQGDDFLYRKLDGFLPMDSVGVDEKQIVGFENRDYIILYYHNADGSPRDLRNKKKWSIFSQSKIHFASDTCLISRNGIVSDYSVMFGGEMSTKQVGALLPDDYQPNEDEQ